MEAADPGGTARREPLVGRRLAELSERQGWVHHVVDADTGEVLTTPLDRPLAPLSRAERLARLGHRIDLPSPWGPVYRLTPGTPTRPRRSTGDLLRRRHHPARGPG